ncbi:M16 family metallopeptidase [uncultured Hymenobacter sp.]|uniref:M16 family metallopeptidase n=1 Tax=uncultured Hymenobacter sp. TaxID=170016 RepID=UPI0035C9A205
MLDRTLAPPVQPLARVTLPPTAVHSLPSGARLHVLANDAQPVVRLQVIFRAGKWQEPQPGLAQLTARMLLEGTATRSARQIADEVAFYGASLECDAGPDRATLTLYCLSRHLPALLPLVLDVLTAPSFPEAELEQQKTRTIQSVRVERQKTSYLASERFAEVMFSAQHPYGRSFDADAYEALTAAQARAFHQAAYPLSAAEVLLCGDVAAQQQQLVSEAFGGAAVPSPAAIAVPDFPTPPPVVNATLTHVPLAGSLQASLRLGRDWPTPQHPDTHRLQLLVKVLGGYFGSRLMKNIREDKGLTYGIYAQSLAREHGSTLVIGTDVNGESADLAVREIQLELRRLQEELISEEELVTVKSYMLGKFANELSTVFEQADKYRTTVLLGLPADYYTQFVEQVQHTDAATLQQLAQQYLAPETMQVVVAGPVVN